MNLNIDEFKKFIDRGNVLDMAIGIMMGNAFSIIVQSFVNDVMGPIIGKIVGGVDLTKIVINLGDDASIMIGTFLQNVVNFLIISFVLFMVVKSSNKFHEKVNAKKQDKDGEEKEEVPAPTDNELLQSIYGELKKINVVNKDN